MKAQRIESSSSGPPRSLGLQPTSLLQVNDCSAAPGAFSSFTVQSPTSSSNVLCHLDFSSAKSRNAARIRRKRSSHPLETSSMSPIFSIMVVGNYLPALLLLHRRWFQRRNGGLLRYPALRRCASRPPNAPTTFLSAHLSLFVHTAHITFHSHSSICRPP